MALIQGQNSGLKCNKLKIPCGPNTWVANAVKICVGHGPHRPYGSGAYGLIWVKNRRYPFSKKNGLEYLTPPLTIKNYNKHRLHQ